MVEAPFRFQRRLVFGQAAVLVRKFRTGHPAIVVRSPPSALKALKGGIVSGAVDMAGSLWISDYGRVIDPIPLN